MTGGFIIIIVVVVFVVVVFLFGENYNFIKSLNLLSFGEELKKRQFVTLGKINNASTQFASQNSRLNFIHRQKLYFIFNFMYVCMCVCVLSVGIENI